VDGRTNRVLLNPAPSAFGFSRDAKHVYGILRGEADSWKVIAIDSGSGNTRDIAVIGFGPLTAVSGFTLHPNGTALLAGVRTPRYDIWMLEGLNHPLSWFRSLLYRSAD
jgi:hypothetical protein